ncbi:hypothetical protein JQK62_22390, partial [Leptospira santarosai]|nr:hypothetical protein [Leptospira santarosai]
TITGLAGTVSAEVTLKFYESATITSTPLGTANALADGSFEATFDAGKAITSVFVTSTETDKPESKLPDRRGKFF